MVRGGEEVDVQRRAHTRELGAESRVGTNVLGVCDGEVVEERLEDGELGREGVGIAGSERGAVRRVVVVLQPARGERGEAGGATAVHDGGCARASSVRRVLDGSDGCFCR